MSRDDVLVSADWAEQNLNADKVVFVEVDEDTAAYDTGHIPGAVKLDWRDDLQDQLRRDLVNAEQFFAAVVGTWHRQRRHRRVVRRKQQLVRRLRVLVFQTVWHADVRLLDGGRKKWELDGRPFNADPVNRAATTYVAKPQDDSIRAYRDDVLRSIGEVNLVDVRSPDEYSGRLLAPAHMSQEQSQRAGHIPTAISVPWSKAANEDGTFKSDAELAELYKAAGLDTDKPTIAYCRIGENTRSSVFVLRELLGHANVSNYDGSWTEYGSLVGVPVALGDEPGKVA